MSQLNPMDGPKCSAHSRGGDQCKRPPIRGGTVCRFHGGAAPQVQARARLRLLELVDPAIAILAREMMKADKSADKQRAANSILDRAGIGRGDTMDGQSVRALLVERLMQLQAAEADTVDVEVIE